MLCMNTYPRDYVDECRARVDGHVATYAKLAVAANGDGTLRAAVDALEPVFFNNLLIALDGSFTHRSRTLEKKDGNPLNEVRVMCASMMLHGDVMTEDRGIKLSPEKSVLGITFGQKIALGQESFARISSAFFAEIESKFVT